MPNVNPSIASQRANPAFHIGALVHGRTDVIHLEFGEPDFATPAHIVEAAQRSIRDERQGYGPGNGMLWLREAIAARVARVNRFSVKPDQIVVTAGGTGALMSSLLCLCEPGDDVLVPDPAWAGYDAMLANAGVRKVYYPLRPDNGWLPDLEALERVLTSRSRVLILNSPSNPGGGVFPRETIAQLMEFARKHDVWVLADECYDEFVYEGEHTSAALFDTDSRVLTVGTCSKAYAMTGWRVGWVAAPPALAPLLALATAAQVNNLPLFVQRAADAALRGPQDCVREMAAAYRSRRDLAMQLLRRHGIDEYEPHGAFYLLIRISQETTPCDSVAFAEALIRERAIAVSPGAAFGPGTAAYVRVSLASDPAALRAGIEGLLTLSNGFVAS
ncbi:MAG TPA: aminotransferase class I/II-fold pyridoxal phosphate-dependent enzyme [Ktedonobacterales bacterium]|nr:aminotransferase class I/II-fold pyridoxal phosphate-dependent enzyme [Ktedonobacterales bacterium]